MFTLRHLLCLTSVLVSMLPLRAELVWHANFESYDTKAGAVPLKVAATLANDSFTGITTSSATLTTYSCEIVRGTTGNALSLATTTNGAAGTATVRVIQSALPNIESTGILIVSFDLTRSGKNGFSLATEARAERMRSGKGLYLPVARTVNGVQRVTIVINSNNAPLALPASLGELPAKSMAAYFYDGTAYTGLLLSKADIVTLPLAGFCTGLSKNNPDAGTALNGLLDNFGAWTSLTDTLNGTSVLSLPPGTVVTAP